MVKFINLETGYIFDGNNPYIFWFENGQSTELIHTKSIGVYSDLSELSISMPENNVFTLINPNIMVDEENVNGFKYHNLDSLKCLSYTSRGTAYNGKYIHVIYFAASSKEIGEFIHYFTINNIDYNIGADFYNENESLYINLSNFGVEIPESIQKTLYTTNVHEDKKDNITLNRKFKELLINYWDVIANRGSYKSLINSIKWFEWGDALKLREMWKKEDAIRTLFDSRELSSMMQDKYISTLSCYSKTTYYALYVSKENITNVLDEEGNPNLEFNSFKWPIIDIMLKMSLLGHFYETYFMPIHLDLIHSTIEDVVFTNTIKIPHGSYRDRYDHFCDFENIHCNINNDDEFILGNVSCQVNKDTQMGVQWRGQEEYADMYIIGADEVVDTVMDEDEAKTFHSQIYNGPGVLVPIELSFGLNSRDFIKSEKITFIHDRKDDWDTFEMNKIYRASRDGKVHINFKLLCTKGKQYDIRLQFESASGRVLAKRIKFNVVDTFSPSLNVFKLVHIKDPQYELLYNDSPLLNAIMRQNDTRPFLNAPVDDEGNTIFPELPIYTQYIQSSNNGAKFNHMIITKNDNSAQINLYLDTYYFKLDLGKKIDGVNTSIYISRDYVSDESLVEKTKQMGIKFTHNKNIFIPQFHEIKEFGGNNIADYTITDETLCCIPNIRYGYKISDWEWTFENISTGEMINFPSIEEPIIASPFGTLTNGFYNIIFRYSLDDGQTRTLKINSAFIKK